MQLRKVLNDLVRVIIDEAERSPEFKNKLLQVLCRDDTPTSKASALKSADLGLRPKNRRMAAILDPVELAAAGEGVLRSKLIGLTLDQLQDIVSEYGMDPGRLVVKWKTPERIIDRIVEMSVARAQKGNAFRSDTDR